MQNRMQSDFLTSTPSFLVGMGSVLNVGGGCYEFNASDAAEEADEMARRVDGWLVAQDLLKTMQQILVPN